LWWIFWPLNPVEVLLKLMEYIYPKRKPVDLDHFMSSEENKVINVKECSDEELQTLMNIRKRMV
jgi:hypothetical protein